jgi:outer membrane receptor protein involved in Fe transport
MIFWCALALLPPQEPPLFENERDLYGGQRDVVGPARRPQPISRAPSSVYRLSSDDLDKLGVLSLGDALRRVPGLEVTRISATELNVSGRGMNDESSAAQGIMGLLDGRQTYNEFLGGVLWNALPVDLEDIESVEVLNGPASFLYGPNALHGLINIVTRSPLSFPEDRVMLRGSAGSYASNFQSLTYVRREGSTGLKVKLVHDDIDPFEGDDENTRDKTYAELRFETVLDEHRFDVTAGIGRQKADVLLAAFGVVGTEVYRNHIDEGFLKALYTWGGLRAHITWTRFRSDSFASRGIYSSFSVVTDVPDIDLQYAFDPAGGHTVTAGVGYRRASFETEDPDISLGRHATGLGWVFVQDEIELAEKLWVTAGLRLDDHSVAGTSTAPRLAAVWEAAPGHTVRASAGVGYRNPSLRELWLDLPVATLLGPGRIMGNRDLDPERTRLVEAAYVAERLGPFGARATLFYSRIDDLIHFVGAQPQNNGNEEVSGGEAELDVLLSESFLLFGNYTYISRRDRDSGRINRGAPRNTGNAGLRFTNSGGWGAILWATAFDSTQFDDPTGLTTPEKADAYALLNARVSWSFSLAKARGSLFVQGLNILDHDHREHPEGDSYGAILSGGVDLAW